MTKKEKEQLKEISEKALTVIEKLDGYCDKQEFCEDCPIDMGTSCCLCRIQTVYNNLTTLLKEKKNDRD